MLTHRIKLPDGTEIEFFASDEATFQQQFGNLARLSRCNPSPIFNATSNSKGKSTEPIKQPNRHANGRKYQEERIVNQSTGD